MKALKLNISKQPDGETLHDFFYSMGYSSREEAATGLFLEY